MGSLLSKPINQDDGVEKAFITCPSCKELVPEDQSICKECGEDLPPAIDAIK